MSLPSADPLSAPTRAASIRSSRGKIMRGTCHVLGDMYRHRIGRAGGLALLALAPKCLVCVASYFGIASILGLSLVRPEFCGVGDSGSATNSTWLAVSASVIGIVWTARRVARSA